MNPFKGTGKPEPLKASATIHASKQHTDAFIIDLFYAA
jgi:Txe/YoeB family toxin of Txe-Axe toxin-antitoxin module